MEEYVTVVDTIPDGLTIIEPSITGTESDEASLTGITWVRSGQTITWTIPANLLPEDVLVTTPVDDGASGTLFRNRATAHGQYTNYTYHRLLPSTVDWEFTKTGEGSAALAGASFALYKKDAAEIVPPGDGWDDDALQTVTSSSAGLVQFDGLELGKDYKLVETKAPAGYELPQGFWIVQVAADGTVTPAAAPGALPPAFAKNGGNYSLPNYSKMTLPLAGGSLMRVVLVVVGIVLLGFAVLELSRKKKTIQQ
jgi:hypothetical protein